MLDGLYSGDRITIAKSLREGEAYVEAADTVEATPDNCKAYEKALGITVTPHPIWRLPRITNAPWPVKTEVGSSYDAPTSNGKSVFKSR